MQKVLIVDDEADIVTLLTMALGRDGRVLLTAYDGHEALEIVREQQPQLILTDVMMPRLDGRELCRHVRADPAISGAKVILMSAGYNIDPRECDADELIRKPFDIFAVAETVDRYLAA